MSFPTGHFYHGNITYCIMVCKPEIFISFGSFTVYFIQPKASRIRHSAHHPSIKLDKGANNATIDAVMKSDISVLVCVSLIILRFKLKKLAGRHPSGTTNDIGTCRSNQKSKTNGKT
jgi:hypothetical protein